MATPPGSFQSMGVGGLGGFQGITMKAGISSFQSRSSTMGMNMPLLKPVGLGGFQGLNQNNNNQSLSKPTSNNMQSMQQMQQPQQGSINTPIDRSQGITYNGADIAAIQGGNPNAVSPYGGMPRSGGQMMGNGLGNPPPIVLGQGPSTTMPPATSMPPRVQRPYSDDAELNHLKAVRKRCVLNIVPVSIALQTFRGAAADGNLDLDRFCLAYREVLKKCRVDAPLRSTQEEVFQLFDRDGNGYVDLIELCCGISMLCQGSEDDKIDAVYDAFASSDGCLTMDDMFKFLCAIFRVVLTPALFQTMRSMGVDIDSPEDLASVTALECFRQAELTEGGKVGLEAFKSWFYAPKNDPAFMFAPMRKLLQ